MPEPAPAAAHRGQPLSTHLILVAAQVCFGSLAVAGRMALTHAVPPNAIVETRLVGGFIVFFALARVRGIHVERRDWPAIFGCALLGMVFNMAFFINGLARSTAVNATVIGSTIPVFTALFAVALGRERLRALRVAGIATSMAGALVLVGVWRVSTGREHMIGNVMVLINAASYGLYLVVVKPLAEKYDPIVLTALLFGCGLVVVSPIGVPAWIELAPHLSGRDVGFLAFIIAVPTVGSYLLTQLALKRAESSLVAAYIYLQPVVATVGAVLLLGERPGPRVGVAALLVLGGVWISTRPARRYGAP
jgi:drug/metabolite transporter (DMT)-like permease